MIVTCPTCSKRFQYDETRFADVRSKHFKCTKCSAIFDILNPSFVNIEECNPLPSEPVLDDTQNKSGVSLVFLTGPKSSRAKKLMNPITVIGRNDGDIITMDPETSKRHAMIEIMGDGSVWLQDLDSTNGTYTNGRAVTGRIQLMNRQEFSCGKSAFMLLFDIQQKQDY
jgi:NAD-dependent SIR2 family protein deacetylase